VCIIGAGELGGAVAHALARGERVARVLLIDSSGTIGAGKALDIQQSGAVEGFHTQLAGTDDLTRATACSVCVIADRAGSPSAEWQGDEGLALLARLAGYIGRAPIVFAGASQSSLLTAAARELGIRRDRLIGSAPDAFASAVTAIVAMEARCSPTEVKVAVLGAPPSSFVIPWSDASIGGYALERVLTQVQLTRLDARVARLWPPGPYALGQAAAGVVEALVTSSRRAFNVWSVLSGEFGVRGRAGALPALLAPSGIVHVRVPTLNTRERVQLETALGT
jgi:malate dehydrogenase